MSEFGERSASPRALIAEFSARVLGKARQLEELNAFFTEALPLVTDVVAVNEQLSERGRADLALTNPAPMMEVTQPSEVTSLKCNNFAPKFEFHTGVRNTGELGPDGRPVAEPIPATTEEIAALRDLPVLRSYREYKDLVTSGRFPAVSLAPTHSSEPAFTRMLILFPEFTTSLVSGMSNTEDQRRYDKFEDQLYVAYQLMTRLVDASDPYVLQEGGAIDDWHLCR